LSSKKTILILTGISWDDTWQRHQQVAKILLESGNNVIFWERIPSSAFSFKKVFQRIFLLLKKRNKVRSKIENNTPENLLRIKTFLLTPGGFLPSLINNIFIKKFTANEFKNKEIDLVINYLPVKTTLQIIENINYKYLWYDCVRAFTEWGGYPKSIQQDESKLVGMVDDILVDSFYLKDYINRIYDKKAVQLLPFVEESDFLLAKKMVRENSEISSFAYFGSLDSHINLDIMLKLADNGYKIHIFGILYIPEKLIDHKNIFYHGYFNNTNEMFSAILAKSDAILIPYKGNMNGVIPAKMVQALAMLRPVFISEFYDSLKLKEKCYIFNSYETLLNEINSFDNDSFNKIRKPLILKFIANNFESSFREKINKLIMELSI